MQSNKAPIWGPAKGELFPVLIILSEVESGGKKSNKNWWPKSSHIRQKGRPKKGQKMHSPQESKKGES